MDEQITPFVVNLSTQFEVFLLKKFFSPEAICLGILQTINRLASTVHPPGFYPKKLTGLTALQLVSTTAHKL